MFVLPGVSFAQTTAPSTASLQATLQSLLAQLQALELQASGKTTAGSGSGSTGGGSGNGGSGSATWCYTFNSNLSIGMSGAAVTALQTALQKDGETVTITGTFDDQTAAAVTGFQEKYAAEILTPAGLTNGTGYAGKATRAELNTLFGCSTGTPITGPVSPTPCVIAPGSNITCPITPTANALYRNSQYGIQFSYPSSYTVKSGSAGLQGGNYGIYPEDTSATSLVTIEMPGSFYPNTGFEGAALNVSVNPSLSSSQCYALVNPNIVSGRPSQGTKSVDGVTFNWVVGGGAAAGTSNTEGHGAGYTNGICYEVNAGAQYSDITPDGVTQSPFSDSVLTSALNSVFATVVFSTPSTCGITPGSNITCPIVPTPVSGVSINSIQPSSGPIGTTLTITGSGFKQGSAFIGDSNDTVWITNGSVKGVLGSYQAQSDTSITARISGAVCEVNNAYSGLPCSSLMTLNPGSYWIYVANGNGTSNSEPFTITATTTPTPAYSLSPSSGAAGTLLTLTPEFTICNSSIPAGQCTQDRYNTFEWVQSGSNVVTPTSPVSARSDGGAEAFKTPTTFTAGTYELVAVNSQAATAVITNQLGSFTVTSGLQPSASLTVSPSKISGEDSAPVTPGEGGVDLLNVDLTAGASSNVTVNTVNLSCGGYACTSGVTNLRLEEVVVNGQGISAVTWTGSASNPQVFTPNLVIPAGETVTLAVYADIPASAPVGQQMQWSLFPGSGLVTITPAGTITGNAQGNLISVASGATTYNGTVVVSLDANTPAPATLPYAGTNQTFATLDLTAIGGNVIIQALTPVSNDANAVNGLADIAIYQGSTEIGFSTGLTPNPSVPGGYTNITLRSPITLTSGQSITVTLKADLTASAAGPLNLGIGGGAGNFATMSPDYSVYGDTMMVAPSPASVHLTVNNSAGPISVAAGANLDLSWFSNGVSNCYTNNQGSWSGSVASNGTKEIVAQSPSASTGYLYQITCSTPSGGSVQSGVQVNVAPAVVQPLVLTAKVSGMATVNLSWTSVTATGMWGYNVYRSTTPGFLPNATVNGIASVVGGTSYTDAKIPKAGTYYYIVAAVDGNGNIIGSPSAQVSAVPCFVAPGSNMACPVSSPMVSDTATPDQTAIMNQALQAELNQLEAMLKAL